MTATESLLARTLLWMTAGAACAIPILVLPQPEDPLLTVTIHLSIVVLFGLALAFHLAPLADEPWFARLPPSLRQAIQAQARQRPPRGYEERLRRYFGSAD